MIRDYKQVSELSVFNRIFHIVCIYVDDLSKDKIAIQSTTYPVPQNDADRYRADNAVDRDVTTCMRTGIIGPNSPDKTVWWRVDLGKVYNIYSVNVLFKNYEGYGIFFLA